MPLVATSRLVADALARGRAVAAFNVITLEHAEAIAAGAEQVGLPAILQISHNAVRFHGRLAPIAAGACAVADASSASLALHLDHVEDDALLRQAADAGFSSAMFDAGALAFEQNVRGTAAAADWAHGAGLWLEAELGYVGGKPDAPASAHAAGVRTDPDEARAFVAATGVDALAVAVGSSHAMTSRTATLDRGLLAAPIANRPRVRPRGLRPHAQHSTRIESRNRSAARARGVNVEHGYSDRHARHNGFVAHPQSAGPRVHQ